MKDEVFNELVQKTVTQIFLDLEKDGEVGKLISKLLSGVIVASVSYAVQETIKTIAEEQIADCSAVVPVNPESEPE